MGSGEKRPGGRLFLGTVAADFDPNRDIALGPWCFIGVEEQHPGWETLPFIDPFPTPENWVAADRQAKQLANAVLPIWAKRLNARHGRSYSLGFWRVLLMKWLAICIPALWQRYRLAEETARQLAGRPLDVECCVVAPGRWPVDGCEGLIEGFASPAWDQRIMSIMLSRHAPPTWRQRPVAAPPMMPARPQSWVSTKPSLLRRLLGRLPVDSVPGAGMAQRLALSLWAVFLPRRSGRSHYPSTGTAIPDTVPPQFYELLDEFLEILLPRSFAEDFPRLEAMALARRYFPGRLFVDALDSEDDGKRIVQAMALERGERLVSVQHGGIYGTAKAMMIGTETEYPYHAFLTWGWTGQEDFAGTFVPVPAPVLSQLAGKRLRNGESLVMVGGAMPVHGSRLGWVPKPQQYLSYRRLKVDFLHGLAPDILGAVRYRPYLRKPEVLRDEDYLREQGFCLPMVEGDLNQAMLDSRLVVIDHPITTMLATLTADIPTVLLWQSDAWPMARQAEPYFQALRDTGILHHDPAAAATHINRVWANVPAWWNSHEVQSARRSFCRNYARTSPIWWWHWMKALARL